MGLLTANTNTQIKNIQIYKYTNAQMHKHTNTRIHKNTNTQIQMQKHKRGDLTVAHHHQCKHLTDYAITTDCGSVCFNHNQYFSSDISSDMDVFYIVAYVGICTSDLSHQFLINNLQMCHQIEAQNNTNMCTKMEIDLKSCWFHYSMKRGNGLRRYLARFPVNCTARLL